MISQIKRNKDRLTFNIQKTQKAQNMEDENINEESISRREFFKKAAKSALPFLAAIALAEMPQIARAATAATSCREKCTSGCTTLCSDGCKNKCKAYCKDNCVNFCDGKCKGCKGGCAGQCKTRCVAGSVKK